VKKILSLAIALGLVGGALALPAGAKKKPKPVAQTLYMEGVSPFGEQDQEADGFYLKLQKDPGSGEKTMGFFNAVASPNTNCGGNSLMPVFVGPVAGHIVGDVKVSFPVASTPANKAEVRIWPDLAAQACNEAYVEPAGMVVVDLPAGPGNVEAVIEGVDFTSQGVMMVQITPILGAPPGYARATYGTEASKVEFTCIPASGTSCI
jgi:hypothetical protein